MKTNYSTRRIALDALMDILEGGAYSNLRLKAAQSGLSPLDAKWVSALVYETLDHLLYIDYVIEDIAKGKMKPVIRCILRLSVCQMLFMSVPPAAACDEGVKLAKSIGKGALSGYVNGVLRELSRRLNSAEKPSNASAERALNENIWRSSIVKAPCDPVDRLSIQYSWPRFIVEEWIKYIGLAQTEALLKSRPFPMQIRAQAPFTTDKLCAVLKERGVDYSHGEYDHDCLSLSSGFDIARDPLFINGSVTAQSESAMLVCRACEAKPNMRMLDACASPGGKSAYLYALAGGSVELHAWEPRENRIELLNKTLSRLAVKADVKQRDATEPALEYVDYFDIVLLDAPCSALGFTKPDARYSKTPEDIISLAKTQKALLDTCSRYVRPGGLLVYATCTISQPENEGQIKSFLKENSGFELEPLPGCIPDGEEGYIQLLPHRHGLEGFFIARMRKNRRCA